MNRSAVKLKARNILCFNGFQAAAVWCLYILIRSALFFSELFFVLCIFEIYSGNAIPFIPDYACYIIFIASLISCFWLSNSFRILFHRWFFCNNGKMGLKSYFKTVSIRQQLRLYVVNALSTAYRLLCIVFFLFPFFAATAGLIYRLKGRGVEKTVLIICSVFLLSLFITGLYFTIAALQKTALFDEQSMLSPESDVKAMLKQAFNRNGYCFFLAKLKISFFAWWLLSIFLFPLFFTAPYYIQSIEQYKKDILLNKNG